VFPEIIHTHPMEGHWKFRGGGGSNNKPSMFSAVLALGQEQSNVPLINYLFVPLLLEL